MPDDAFRIASAKTRHDFAAIADLFEGYAAGLGTDLGYQGFAAEVAALPGKYARPTGALLLARGSDEDALGCVALRAIPFEGCCEMKRLYVAPAGRGLGLGRALMEAIVAEARRIGYCEMRLDSLPSMKAAQALYLSAGFKPIPPYYETPVAGTRFLALPLI